MCLYQQFWILSQFVGARSILYTLVGRACNGAADVFTLSKSQSAFIDQQRPSRPLSLFISCPPRRAVGDLEYEEDGRTEPSAAVAHCRFLGVQKVPIQSNHIGKYSVKSALIWCFELISWPRVSKDMTTLG